MKDHDETVTLCNLTP